MNLWFDNIKINSYPLKIDLTIGNLKKEIDKCLISRGIPNYNIKMYINQEEVDPIVFNTNTYDNNELSTFPSMINNINIYTSRKINTNTINIDSLLLLIKQLPGQSVLALCNTNKELYTLCERHTDKIYTMLLKRDYPLEKYKGIGTIKQFYSELLKDYGATYVSDIYYDENNYPYIGDILRIPKIDEIETNQHKLKTELAVFNLLNFNLSVGQKYWIYIYSRTNTYGNEFIIYETDIRKTREELFEYNSIPEDMDNLDNKIEYYGNMIKAYEIKELSLE